MDEHLADSLPTHLRDALLAEIDPGETLRWCGIPSPERAFRKALPLSCVAIVFFGGVGAMFVLASRSIWLELHGLEPLIDWTRPGERPDYAGVWLTAGAAAFLALLSLLALLMPWLAARQARRTVYAVTPTRIMKIELVGPRRPHVEAIEPGHPLHIVRKDVGSGRGDILLYPRERRPLLSFTGVEDARNVERLIRATFDPPK